MILDSVKSASLLLATRAFFRHSFPGTRPWNPRDLWYPDAFADTRLSRPIGLSRWNVMELGIISPSKHLHCSVFVIDVWYLSAIGIFSWLLPQQCLRGFVLLLRLLPVFGSSKRWALAQIVVNQISQIHLNRGLWWKHEELNWSCWVKCWCRTCRHWCFPCLKCVRKTNVDSPYINISLLPGRVKWGSSSMAMSRVSASK